MRSGTTRTHTAPLLITATSISPHSELHFGHLAGPYFPADVLTRFLRVEGGNVLLTSGASDHAASVELRALRTGRAPAAVAAP